MHNQRDDLVILEILRVLFEGIEHDLSDCVLRLLWGVTGNMATALVEGYLPGVKMKDIAEAIKKAYPNGFPPSREQLIKAEFAKLVDRVTEKGNKRLVIAIDNLDRCRPEAALRVLETLYLITHVPNCAFIVAADQQVLVSFLNREYKGTDFSGTKYREKVFPYYYRVPDPWVAWDHQYAKAEKDEVLALLEYLIDEKNPWRKDAETFEMVWFYFAHPRALRNPRRIKRILRRVTAYEFDRKDLENYSRATLSQNLLFLVILSDLWPQVLEFYMTCGQKAWREWLDYMAKPADEQPITGILLDDAELQDFLHLVAGIMVHLTRQQ